MKKAKNIILIGFMGSGKTAVGKLLAKQLGWKFVDTDDLIEKAAGITIAEIFKKSGEPHFRDLESCAVQSLKGYNNFVIATGGGIILRPENVAQLKKLGPLVLLWVAPQQVRARVAGTLHRPLLNTPDAENKAGEILQQRTPLYRSAAEIEIDTTDLGVNQVVDKILEELNG
ncbi:MAG: shikimate kinase [Candidatus Margulisiibacteriota bacterium]